MAAQFSIQDAGFAREILHLGSEVRTVTAEAMDEQEFALPCTCSLEG